MKIIKYPCIPLSFYGFSGIPDPEKPGKTVAGIIHEWSVTEGTLTSPEQKIGVVEVSGKFYGVVICFPALIQCLYASEGSSVAPDDPILKWFNEGQNIPSYRQSYFRLESNGVYG